MAYKPGFLDRIINPTFGVIQQPLWRIWRAMHDEDIDVLSGKGLLDPHLFPILGMAFDPKNTVMMDDASLKPIFGESFGGQLAGAVLTDPLTYLSGGLTAGAKMSRRLGKDIQNIATKTIDKAGKEVATETAQKMLLRLSNAAAGNLDEAAKLTSVGLQAQNKVLGKTSFKSLMDEVAKANKNKGSILGPDGVRLGEVATETELSLLQKLQKDMDKFGADDLAKLADSSVQDVLGHFNKREMGIGIPLLGDLFGMYTPVNKSFQEWGGGGWMKTYFKTVKKFYTWPIGKATKLTGAIVNPVLSNIPVVNKVVAGQRQMADDFVTGWKQGDTPDSMVNYNAKTDSLFRNLDHRNKYTSGLVVDIRGQLDVDVNGTLQSVENSGLDTHAHVAAFVDSLAVPEGGKAMDVFLDLFGDKQSQDAVLDLISGSRDLPPALQKEALTQHLTSLVNKSNRAVLEMGMPDMTFATANYSTSASMKLGADIKSWTTKLFSNDLGIKGGKDAQNFLNRIRSNFTQYARQVGQDMYKATRAVALDRGMDPSAVQAFHSAYLGTIPQVDELKVFFKEYANSQKPLSQLNIEFQEWFGARMNSHLESIMGMNVDELGLKGAAVDEFQTLVDSLSLRRNVVNLEDIKHLDGVVGDFAAIARTADAEGNISLSSLRGVLAGDTKLAGSPELNAHVLQELRIQEYQLYHLSDETVFSWVDGFKFDDVNEATSNSAILSWTPFEGNPKHATFTSDVWDNSGRSLRNTGLGTRKLDDLFGSGTTDAATGATKYGGDGGVMKSLERAKAELAKVDVKKPKSFSADVKRMLGTDTKDARVLSHRLAEVQKQVDADYSTVKRFLQEEHFRKDYTPLPVREALGAELHPTLTKNVLRIGQDSKGKAIKDLTELPNLVVSSSAKAGRVSKAMRLHAQIMQKQRAIEVWKDLQGSSVVTAGLSGQGVPSAFLLGMEDDIVQLGVEMKNMFSRVLNGGADTGSGSALLDLADEIKLNAYQMALKNDVIGGAMPLGYMHRVLSGKENKVIDHVYGDLVDAIQAAGLTNSRAMRIVNARTERSMTIKDINTVTAEFASLARTSKAVRDVVRVFEKVREQLTGTTKLQRFSEDPVASIVAHVSEVNEAVTRRMWLEYISSDKGKELGFMAGKIVGVSINEVATGSGVRLAPTTKAALPGENAVRATIARGRLLEIDEILNATPLNANRLKPVTQSKQHINEALKDGVSFELMQKQIGQVSGKLATLAEKDGISSILKKKINDLRNQMEHFDTIPTQGRREQLKIFSSKLDEIIKPKKPVSQDSLIEGAFAPGEAPPIIELLKKERKELTGAIDEAIVSSTIDLTSEAVQLRRSSRISGRPVGADTEAMANMDIRKPNSANFDQVFPEDAWAIDGTHEYLLAGKARNIVKRMYQEKEINEEHVYLLRAALRDNPTLIGANVGEIDSWIAGSRFRQQVPLKDLRRAKAAPPTKVIEPVKPVEYVEEGRKLGGEKTASRIDAEAGVQPRETPAPYIKDTGLREIPQELVELGRKAKVDFRMKDLKGNPLESSASVSIGDAVQHTLRELDLMTEHYANNPIALEKIRKLSGPLIREAQDMQYRSFIGAVGKMELEKMDGAAIITNTHGSLKLTLGEDGLRDFLKTNYTFFDDAHLEKVIKEPGEFVKVVAESALTEKGVKAAEAAGLGKFVRRFGDNLRRFVSFLVNKLTLNKRLDPNTTENVAATLNQLVRATFDIDGDIALSKRVSMNAYQRLTEYTTAVYQKQGLRIAEDAASKFGRLGSPEGLGTFINEATESLVTLERARDLALSGRSSTVQKAINKWTKRSTTERNAVAAEVEDLMNAEAAAVDQLGFFGETKINPNVDLEAAEHHADQVLHSIDLDVLDIAEVEKTLKEVAELGFDGDMMQAGTIDQLMDGEVFDLLDSSQKMNVRAIQDMFFGRHRRGNYRAQTGADEGVDFFDDMHENMDDFQRGSKYGKHATDEGKLPAGTRELEEGEVLNPAVGRVQDRKSGSESFFAAHMEEGTGAPNIIDRLTIEGKLPGVMTGPEFRAHHRKALDQIESWEQELERMLNFMPTKTGEGKTAAYGTVKRTPYDGLSGNERLRSKDLLHKISERKRKLVASWEDTKAGVPQAIKNRLEALQVRWAKNLVDDVQLSKSLADTIVKEFNDFNSPIIRRLASVKLLATSTKFNYTDVRRIQTELSNGSAKAFQDIVSEDEWNVIRKKIAQPQENVTLSTRESDLIDLIFSPKGMDVNVHGPHPIAHQSEIDKVLKTEKAAALLMQARLKDKLQALKQINFKNKTVAQSDGEVQKAIFGSDTQGYRGSGPAFEAHLAETEDAGRYGKTEIGYEEAGEVKAPEGSSVEELVVRYQEDPDMMEVIQDLMLRSKESDNTFIEGVHGMIQDVGVNGADVMRTSGQFLDELTMNYPRIGHAILSKIDDTATLKPMLEGSELIDAAGKLKKPAAVEKAKVAARKAEVKEAKEMKAAFEEMNKQSDDLIAKAEAHALDPDDVRSGLTKERQVLKNEMVEAERGSFLKKVETLKGKIRKINKKITEYDGQGKEFLKKAKDARNGVGLAAVKGRMSGPAAIKKFTEVAEQRRAILSKYQDAEMSKLEARYSLNPELMGNDFRRTHGTARHGLRTSGHTIVRKELASPSTKEGMAVLTEEGRKYREKVWKQQVMPERRQVIKEMEIQSDVPGGTLANKLSDQVGDGSTASETRAASNTVPNESGSGVDFKVDATKREVHDRPFTLHIEDFETKQIREVDGKAFSDAGQTIATYGVGEDIAGALANSSLTGQGGRLIKGSDVNPESVMSELLNQHVTIGPENYNRAAATTLALDKPSGMAGMAKFYDNAHSLMKLAATGLRIPLDFHAANMLSSIPQAALEGIGPTNMLQGMIATMRLLSRNAEQLGLDDISVLLQGAKSNPRAARLPFSKYLTADNLQTIAETGRRGAGGLEFKGLEDIPEELLFRDSLGRAHSIPDMVMAMMDNGALDSMVRADLQNMVHGDTAVASIRREFLDKTAGRTVGKNLMNFAEGSELFVRFSAMHGALNAGMDLNTAGRAVSEAMINYSDITHLERRYLKRATFFYTYPRKMIPKALGYLFNNPNKASMLINGIIKPLTANDVLQTSEGRPEIVINEMRVNAARINPFIDSLTSLGAVADMIFPSIGRDRELEGVAPWDKPISPSPVANIMGWSEFFPMEDPLKVNQDWLEEGRRANWAIKMLTGSGPLLGSGDPEVNYTPLELVARTVMPFRKVRPAQEAGRRLKRIAHYRYEYANQLKSAVELGNITEQRVLQDKIFIMDKNMDDIRMQHPSLREE